MKKMFPYMLILLNQFEEWIGYTELDRFIKII